MKTQPKFAAYALDTIVGTGATAELALADTKTWTGEDPSEDEYLVAEMTPGLAKLVKRTGGAVSFAEQRDSDGGVVRLCTVAQWEGQCSL